MFSINSKTFNQLTNDEKVLIKSNIIKNKDFLTTKSKSKKKIRRIDTCLVALERSIRNVVRDKSLHTTTVYCF